MCLGYVLTCILLRGCPILIFFLCVVFGPLFFSLENGGGEQGTFVPPPPWIRAWVIAGNIHKGPAAQLTHNVTTTLHLSCGKVVSHTTFIQRCRDVVSLHNVVTT